MEQGLFKVKFSSKKIKYFNEDNVIIYFNEDNVIIYFNEDNVIIYFIAIIFTTIVFFVSY
jgi:regulatory protein YycI of two-component signal transduction system YycFG